MPEGHKTHFLARQHSDWLANQTLRITSPQGRFRAGAKIISGETLERVEAIGKHLFYHFESDAILHIHLGRYGKFRVHDNPAPKPVGAVRVRMVGQSIALDLNGPTTCAVIRHEDKTRIENRLGPDPLGGGRLGATAPRIIGSKKTIGAILLDQSVIAGIGNIFRAELLFELGIHPEKRGCDLSQIELKAIWKALTKMMKTGLKYGKIITVHRNEVGVPLGTLEGNDRFRIYGKTDCPKCGSLVQKIKSASRKLYFCPTCQSN